MTRSAIGFALAFIMIGGEALADLPPPAQPDAAVTTDASSGGDKGATADGGGTSNGGATTTRVDGGTAPATDSGSNSSCALGGHTASGLGAVGIGLAAGLLFRRRRAATA